MIYSNRLASFLRVALPLLFSFVCANKVPPPAQVSSRLMRVGLCSLSSDSRKCCLSCFHQLACAFSLCSLLYKDVGSISVRRHLFPISTPDIGPILTLPSRKEKIGCFALIRTACVVGGQCPYYVGFDKVKLRSCAGHSESNDTERYTQLRIALSRRLGAVFMDISSSP